MFSMTKKTSPLKVKGGKCGEDSDSWRVLGPGQAQRGQHADQPAGHLLPNHFHYCTICKLDSRIKDIKLEVEMCFVFDKTHFFLLNSHHSKLMKSEKIYEGEETIWRRKVRVCNVFKMVYFDNYKRVCLNQTTFVFVTNHFTRECQ